MIASAAKKRGKELFTMSLFSQMAYAMRLTQKFSKESLVG
jgi:hypothetical protein